MPNNQSAKEILSVLHKRGWLSPSESPKAEPLTGGVSSDIWKLDLKAGPVCVKRALSKLKVKDDWFAPVSRNGYEVAWMQTARKIQPGSAPEILFHDVDAGLFVMPFLDPDTHPLWKASLRDGHTETSEAAAVGKTLGRIHTNTASDPDIAARFNTDDIFHAIRLEPYLLATGKRHPDLDHRLSELSEITASNCTALVHGDVSPKNILIGPDGPVFLDAECAWYGDPAFDLAFCLNHLLLKGLWNKDARRGYQTCFTALSEAYEKEIASPLDASIMKRAAHLLPGLFLARVDGKSPVEYITDEGHKNLVRKLARQFLTTPVNHPIDICDAWYALLSSDD